MKQTIAWTAREVRPAIAEVIKLQGIPSDAELDERVKEILREAGDRYETLAKPVGLYEEVAVAEFAAIFRGEGANEPETPLARIFPRADKLALFAVTLGEPVCAQIRELFATRDFALAALLDSVASAAADQAAAVLEQNYAARLHERGEMNDSARALRYSPGYCGWHVSGQKTLFARLEPGAIGISLRESCLMQPLKSVSGVIVCGPAAIHDFNDDFPFCADCTTHSCRERH
jgi:hypothetical protein